MSSRAAAIGVLMFASFMDLIDTTIVNVALPTMRSDLGASGAQLQWIVGGYTLALAVLLVTGGRIGDVFGRRTVFITGVLGFTAASLSAGMSETAGALVAARVAQGAFAALMVPQLISTIQVLYAPKERAAVFGAVGAVSGMAAVIGPLLGGWLVTADYFGLGWRSVFVINVPIGIVLAMLALRLVPQTRPVRRSRLDLTGVAVATVGLLLLVYPLIEGQQHGWPAWVWLMIAAAALVLAGFAWLQRRTERRDGSALLPMHLFANRGFSAGLVTQASFQAALVGLALVVTIYLQAGLGFSPIRAGLVFLPFSIGAILGTAIAVPLGVRLGKVVPFAGGLLQAAGVGWLARVIGEQGDHLGHWALTLPFAITGVGLALTVIPLIDIALSRVPASDAGPASGTYSTIQQVGAALGVAIIGSVFFSSVAGFTPAGLRHALETAAWWVAGGYLFAAAATLMLPSRAAVRAHAEAEQGQGVLVD